MKVKIGTLNDISKKLCFEVKGKKIAIFNVNGKLYALKNECTHKDGPLCQGKIEGRIVTCPWHGAKFDVITGKVLGPPAVKKETKYNVTVNGNDVYVEL